MAGASGLDSSFLSPKENMGALGFVSSLAPKENEGAGDVFELKEKGSYVLPIPKSERERNTEIEIFDRPNSEPVNN